MTTAFQQSAFQDDAWQIDGLTVSAAVIPTGVKRKLRRYVKDENLEKLFPHLRDWEEEQQRERRQRRRQLYKQTLPAVQLIEFPPIPGRAYIATRYSPDEIPIDRSLDRVAQAADDEETEELIRLLGALD